MRKVLLSLSLFCAATSASMAMKVTGKVTDESGALPGASVMIKGTDEGVETDDQNIRQLLALHILFPADGDALKLLVAVGGGFTGLVAGPEKDLLQLVRVDDQED